MILVINFRTFEKPKIHCAQFKRGPKSFRKGTKRGPDFEQKGDPILSKKGPKGDQKGEPELKFFYLKT